MRRLFIFLERSIYEGTQWVVFEPDDDKLWARLNRTTMSQDDILNGRLIGEIGIAPVRPAEFVVFRISQHTAESQG